MSTAASFPIPKATIRRGEIERFQIRESDWENDRIKFSIDISKKQDGKAVNGLQRGNPDWP